MATRTDTETALQVVALIARGDTYQQISDALGMPISTIQAIKQRNQPALAAIQSKLVEHKITSSRKILDKAHGLIEKKLDRVIVSETEREKALGELREGEIDSDEYYRRVFGLSDATLTELNSLARDAFTQSQIEQGKPTSIGGSSHEAKEDLLRLAQAIKDGDEVVLERLVFNPQPERDIIEGEIADESGDESITI